MFETGAGDETTGSMGKPVDLERQIRNQKHQIENKFKTHILKCQNLSAYHLFAVCPYLSFGHLDLFRI